MKTLGDAVFEFTHGETREQRQQRKLAIWQSAERLAKTMKPEFGQQVLDTTEIALYGHLLSEEMEEK